MSGLRNEGDPVRRGGACAMCAKHIGFLIKPASSACNMRCRYCFYCDVAAHREERRARVMGWDVADAIIEHALAVAPDAHVSFAFQGGEPTLAGLDFFRSFVARVEERRDRQQVSWALQTNGYLIDGEWAAFFREHGFLIGVSVDAYRDLHDSMRPDAHGAATYARVMGGVRLLRESGVDVNILSVLTSQMAAHPQRVFSFIKREGITHIQFIPCLPGLDDEHDAFSLGPREFSSFYRRLFDLWWRELGAGSYVSIWLFENIMQMALGQFPSQCGMLGRCAPQFVVESDGSVYPCDFYALDEYRVGDIRNDGLEAMATCEAMRAFLREPRRACSRCADCPFEGMCHRNCKRLNIAYYDEGYCGLREFLEYAYPGLQRVARMLARR
ncbi:Anaerobic sulfatase-maturating enzyme [Collinsella intestinalis]|nr:Anaerobic sulfatase-maturating enzyme [Collinsella intestinalis]